MLWDGCVDVLAGVLIVRSTLGRLGARTSMLEGAVLEVHLTSVQCCVWFGVLQLLPLGRAVLMGLSGQAGTGPARDAHPAHACGHESEPERKRPRPAQSGAGHWVRC